MRHEQAEPSEVDPAGAQRCEDLRQSPSRTRYENAVVGSPLGETEFLHAEGEHRRIGALRMQIPGLDFTEMKEQFGFDQARFAGELARAGKKVRIIHHRDRWIEFNHEGFLALRFWHPARPRPALSPARVDS